jgi:hypothetical protein
MSHITGTEFTVNILSIGADHTVIMLESFMVNVSIKSHCMMDCVMNVCQSHTTVHATQDTRL